MFAVWGLQQIRPARARDQRRSYPSNVSIGQLCAAADADFAGQQGQDAEINGLRLTLPAFTDQLLPFPCPVRLNAGRSGP
jgi:hypothetical protein